VIACCLFSGELSVEHEDEELAGGGSCGNTEGQDVHLVLFVKMDDGRSPLTMVLLCFRHEGDGYILAKTVVDIVKSNPAGIAVLVGRQNVVGVRKGDAGVDGLDPRRRHLSRCEELFQDTETLGKLRLRAIEDYNRVSFVWVPTIFRAKSVFEIHLILWRTFACDDTAEEWAEEWRIGGSRVGDLEGDAYLVEHDSEEGVGAVVVSCAASVHVGLELLEIMLAGGEKGVEQRAGVQEVRPVEEETAGELVVVRVSSVARFCWRPPVSFGLGQSAGVEQSPQVCAGGPSPMILRF